MGAAEAKEKLQGVLVAAPTQMNADFSVDLEGVKAFTRFLVDKGIVNGSGVILSTGAGGEYLHLTLEERKAVTQAAVEAAAGRVPVFAGASHTSTLHAVEIARHAADVGADGLQVSPPYYFVPSADEVFEFYKAINDAADIGIMIYSDPWASGVDMSARLIERLATLPNVIGLKWYSGNLPNWTKVYERFAERLSIIDNQLVWTKGLGFMMGARGFVSQVANFAPENELNILRLLRAKEWEKVLTEVSRLTLPYYRLLYAAMDEGLTGEGNFIKTALEILGLPDGPARPPHRPLPPKYREEMRRILAAAGLV